MSIGVLKPCQGVDRRFEDSTSLRSALDLHCVDLRFRDLTLCGSAFSGRTPLLPAMPFIAILSPGMCVPVHSALTVCI